MRLKVFFLLDSLATYPKEKSKLILHFTVKFALVNYFDSWIAAENTQKSIDQTRYELILSIQSEDYSFHGNDLLENSRDILEHL